MADSPGNAVQAGMATASDQVRTASSRPRSPLHETSKTKSAMSAPVCRLQCNLVDLADGRLWQRPADSDVTGNLVARQPLGKTTVAIAIRPEKVKLSRRGPASDAAHVHSLNRLEGVVTDVSYLGGLTTYKVKLDTGAIVRSSMANTTRIDMDAYGLSQRVVAWFTPDDCMVLEQ